MPLQSTIPHSMSYSPDKESITIFLPKGSRALLKAKRKKAGHNSMNTYCAEVLVPELHGKTSLIGIIRSERRDYEDQITRDRALIQTLVNALDSTEDLDNGCPLPTWHKGYDEMCDMRSNALDAAKEQGFTPTEG